jgi:hypothetical protein
MRYFYCPKCRALLHPVEVNQKDLTHELMVFLTASGEERSVIHTGLIQED